MPQTKSLIAPVELKDSADGTGEVVAKFSTFDIIDREGDIVRRSAFTDGQQVKMVWAHDWTAPIGKGVIKVKSDHAEFHGQFLSDADSQEKRIKIRDLGSLQEWSFGFRILDVQDNQQIRGLDITEAEVFEVSPVLVGANQETATIAVKSAESPKEPAWERPAVLVELDAMLAGVSEGDDLPVVLRRVHASVLEALAGMPDDPADIIERELIALEESELEEVG